MPFSAIITLEKPLPHITLADWNSRVNALRNVADARRKDAFDLRHTSRTLRNDARIATDQMHELTNAALVNRMTELQNWRSSMEQVYNRILREVDMLSKEKAETERELDYLQNPLSVISECLTMRDCRLGSEMTYDDADNEIKQELAIAENNQQLLSDQCQKAWEKLTRLEDIKFKLGIEIDNKREAETVDATQLQLNKNSSNITFKTNPLRIPEDSCSYEAWLDHVNNIKQMAENELSDTYAIREALLVSRERARNLLRAQQDRAEHAIRKRIFETQRARNELEWQQKKMHEEMEKATCELHAMQATLREQANGVKLAETRLENRAQRSGMELCTDDAYEKLCVEVDNLNQMRNKLSHQIDDLKTNLNLMSSHVNNISVDLENKQHSLMTDIRALDLRKRLRGGLYGNPVLPTQTDRNIQLTQLSAEIPKC